MTGVDLHVDTTAYVF